jgi:S1-C subfamily serine protease
VKEVNAMNHRLHQRLTPQGIIAIKVGDGPAKKAGIRKGDIILQINNQKIKDSKYFMELVSSLQGRRIT